MAHFILKVMCTLQRGYRRILVCCYVETELFYLVYLVQILWALHLDGLLTHAKYVVDKKG